MRRWIVGIGIVGAVVGVSIFIPSYVAHGPVVVDTTKTKEVVATSSETEVAETLGVPYVRINEHVFSVEVADTMALRSRGLSGHLPLEKNEGMLFVFGKPGIQTFWMKEMTFSIDMVWISEDNTIVHIESNVSPDTYPKETFSSKQDALYVLETSANVMNDLGIQVGDTVEIVLK